ncbi:hypothetical protein [Nocardia aurea]|uniref:SnoaL-like domain-containing protein n=1 Tax=Nocardia aurea TaxID=2144174 RepID=A0ABV3FVW0_9NOCA
MTLTLDGYGHSDETYEKSGGRWRVETSTSTRLREDIATPLFSIHVSEHIGNAGTGFARKSAGRPSGKA